MATFNADYRGLGELLSSYEMEAEMRRRADKVAARFEATAPRETGQFASSAQVSSTRRGGVRKDRAAGVVTVTDPAAAHIELGTSDTPAHHTLRNALTAARD